MGDVRWVPSCLLLGGSGSGALRFRMSGSGSQPVQGARSSSPFAMLVVVAALGFTYTAPDGSFPASELPPVLLRVMAISGLLFVAALAFPPNRGISNAALALATLAGVFTVYLVHTDLFHPSNRIWITVVLAACLFALFTAFRVIDEFRWSGFALTVAATFTVSPQPGGRKSCPS